MNKLYSISLVAFALTAGAVTAQARPFDKSLAEARGRLTQATEGRYMRLDSAPASGCAAYLDGGENRFDRMYDSIGPSRCSSQR